MLVYYEFINKQFLEVLEIVLIFFDYENRYFYANCFICYSSSFKTYGNSSMVLVDNYITIMDNSFDFTYFLYPMVNCYWFLRFNWFYMRTLVFGDIHGRLIWEDILKKEKDIDKIVFLGDYVTTHESISDEQQLFNFEDILTYKEDNPEKVILLRGDPALWKVSWGDCTPRPSSWLKKKLLFNFNQFSRLSQWLYIQDNIIFSHAGVSQIWLDSSGIVSIDDINDKKPSEIFGFCPGPDNPFDMYGDSIYQSCEWIRPDSLYKSAVENTIQVVGHTNYGKVVKKYNEERNVTIYLCDALPDEYLIIEDGNFIIKKNE